MTKLSILFGGSLVAAAALSIAMTSGHKTVAVGSAAPTFDATDSHGNSIRLSDYRGKYVVLEWSNFECPYVRKQYDSHNMQNLQKKYTAKGVVWLTVYSSAPTSGAYLAPSKLNSMAKQSGMASVIVPDPKGTLGHLYRATNTPDMFVINPEGKLIYSGAIDSDRSPDPDAIRTATNYVAAALDASMHGKTVAVASSRPYGCGIQYARE